MFFIVEQGNRVQTPIDRILKDMSIDKLAATNRIRPINAKNEAGVKAKIGESLHPYHPFDEHKQRQKVLYASQIMSTPIICASIHSTVDDSWTLFSKHSLHHLPVLDSQQRLQGIVSDRDLLRIAANTWGETGQQAVSHFMTRKIITAQQQTAIRTIAEVMVTGKIGAVPIVDHQGELLGTVSRSDILRTLVNNAPLDLWA